MHTTELDRLPERFRSKIDFAGPGGCWIWTKSIDSGGYGQWWLGPVKWMTHRLAYALLVGPIPPGAKLDHRCFVHRCVNPDHLRVATTKQNGEHLSGPPAHNTSGVRGVSWHRASGKWRVYATHNGRQVSGGQFDRIEDADTAAIALRARLFTHDDGRLTS